MTVEKSIGIVTIFVIVAWVFAAQDPMYDEILSLGLNCTPIDICDQNLTRSRDLQSLNERSCACDKLCTLYDDCCIDKPIFDRSSSSPFTCVKMRNYQGVFMITKCPQNWNGDVLVRRGCEESPTIDNKSDPISTLPVTDSKRGVTYKNINCATCHNRAGLGDLTLWQLRLEFADIRPEEHRGINLTELVLGNPVFENGTWGFRLNSSGEEYFREATVDASLPVHLETKIRVCKPDLISDCCKDWVDKEVRRKCRAYQGALYHKDRHNETKRVGYRNAHCAICNRANLSHLVCKSPDSRSMFQFRSFNAKAFSVLVDITDRNDVGVGQKVICPDKQVYDVLFQRCRSLSCFNSNQVLRKGKCENIVRNQSVSPLYTPRFVSCPQVFLAPGEFEILNGSLRVPVYGLTYEFGDFRLWGNGVFVCSNQTSERGNKFSPAMGYVTLICLSLSLICLFLHVLFFFVVPDWQNLSSKNLTSLAAALFLAYLGFLIAQWDPLPKDFCLFLAIEMFYFFLASFFWMNAMAFDVWRTLRMATRELRVNSGQQWCRYTVYSIYGWFVPACIVCTAVILDQTDILEITSQFRPGFGLHWCWFGSRKALLVFFVAPMMFVMLANMAFFVSSARMIMSTTKGTLKHTAHAGNNRRNFRLYWKLAVMLGLSWTFGLVASYLNLETLWYVFVVLNCLNGAFIFVAFTCNGKVKKYVSDKVALVRRRRAYHTSSLNSGSAYNSNSTEPSFNAAFKTSSTDLKSRSVSSI